MKKIYGLLMAGSLLYACGSGDTETAKTNGQEQGTESTAPTGPAIPNERGLELIGSNDCTTCHAIDKKLIGPSYVDVANKYEPTDAVIDTLVAKIKHGGTGNWGQIPMTPHPDLADADAREMVQYILSLKNQ